MSGTHPPWGPNSFNLMQFLGKFGKIVCWRPPPGELAPPPRGSRGSATGICIPVLRDSTGYFQTKTFSVFSAWQRTARVFYPYFQGFMESRSLLVVYVFTSPDSLRGPPWNEGHRPKVHHETDVLEVPASGTTRTQFLF